MGRLRRLDDLAERHAWLVLAFLFLLEALAQVWIAEYYWPRQGEREFAACQEALSSGCRPERTLEQMVARFLALALTIASLVPLGFYLLRFVPAAQAVPRAVALVARWILGTLAIVLGVLAIIVLASEGDSSQCYNDECVSYARTTLDAQHGAFAIALIAAGLNLFPRRLDAALAAPS